MHKVLLITFYGLTVFTHMLIMARVIPFQWVNGGMSPSFEAQAVQSAISILVLGAIFLFVWKIVTSVKELKKWQKYTLYGITALWCIGFLQQLLGTSFERYFMTLVLALGVIAHILVIKKKK